MVFTSAPAKDSDAIPATAEDALHRFRSIDEPIERYMFLRDFQKYHDIEFFKLLNNHTQEIMPFVYTPTVGEACQRYGELDVETRGLYITANDRGTILDKLRSWPTQEIDVVVVTDGERILGLGDLGVGGMGISEGKILLYTVCAGVSPFRCLPVCLDVGTNNPKLLNDENYKGLKQERIPREEYDTFVEEFMGALKSWRPHVLLQFEDFGNSNAFRLLDKYRPTHCCFNDDIEGTASITLAGILSALRVTGQSISQQRVMFLGAGEAGVGIGELISMAIERGTGKTREEARQHCFFIDSRGLVCKSRTGLQHHKQAFAHDVEFQPNLLEAINALRPTILIGVSTQHGAFNQEVCEAMAKYNERPVIFPLSNPTSQAECTFEEAFNWTDGRVLFASGSPFPQLLAGDKTLYPAQANNAYIFPAIGHAAVLGRSPSITDEVFLVAAEALAEMTTTEELDVGMLFPLFDRIQEVSVHIMVAVSLYLEKMGLVTLPAGETSWEAVATKNLWKP